MSTEQALAAAPGQFRGCLRRLAALIRHDVLLIRRDPGPAVSRLCMPVVLMPVFEPLYRAAIGPNSGNSAIAEAAPRVLVIFSVFAVSTIGAAMLNERTWRTWSWQRATPASAWELLLAKTLPLFGVLLLQQALVLGVAGLVFGLRLPGSVVVLAVAGAAWALCILAFGALVATFARTNNQLSSTSDVTGLLLSSLGGAIVPVQLMPAWMQVISPLSPAHWGLQALRGALLGHTGDALAGAALLIGLAALVGGLACWRINRYWGRPELL